MTRIVVVGELNMDLHLFDVERSAGQALLVAERYLAEPGGKGANVARAAARLGAEVSLVGRVGDDEFGRSCVAAVSDDGVDTGAVTVTSDGPTGFVAIELTRGKHRSLLFAPGANGYLSWTDIAPSLDALESGDIVIAQAEIPPAALSELATFTARTGTALFLDPAPPDRVTRQLIAAAEVITPNRAEAAALVGRMDDSPLTPALAARDLLEFGARRVLVKTGESGTLLAGAHREILEVPTLSVEPLDETGAGDVFLAALAVRRSEGAEWEQAVRFANAASALSVAATGLMLPERSDVDQAVRGLEEPTTRISLSSDNRGVIPPRTLP
ncbi:MAG: ribokinase [Thermoleophilia bacterium]|nr:ribokinase [Thermoleophilia bacterium]MDH3724857.1 ribokinase [Thermoleophilia bacterium]